MPTQVQIDAAAAAIATRLDAYIEAKAPGFIVAEVEAELKALAPQIAQDALTAAAKAATSPQEN